MAQVVCSNHTGPIVLFTIRSTAAVYLAFVLYENHGSKEAQHNKRALLDELGAGKS